MRYVSEKLKRKEEKIKFWQIKEKENMVNFSKLMEEVERRKKGEKKERKEMWRSYRQTGSVDPI